MKTRRRTGFGVALAVAVGMLFLAGCGDDSDDTAATTEASETTEAAEAVSPEEIATEAVEVQAACDLGALEALLDPDVVLTIEFEGQETVFTGSAEVLASFEDNWATGCPETGDDFEVISVEGSTVTTESTGSLPDGTRVRPTSVYEVSDDGLVTSIRFIQGPVVTDDG